jgi:hypothetical protein
MIDTNKKRVIVTGMHRCGTSFMASWLQALGVNIGDALAGATPSNKLGHFEDIEILEFHESLLKANMTSLYESSDRVMKYTEEDVELAKSFTLSRDKKWDVWGWKQPRAALFLDLWESLGFNMYYIILIRDPLAVVNSLLKRESKKILLRNPSLGGGILYEKYMDQVESHANQYFSMYERHNREVLKHLEGEFGKRVLVADFDMLAESGRLYFDHLKREWGMKLKWSDPCNLHSRKMKINEDEFVFQDKEKSREAYVLYNSLRSHVLV